jgi:hypothetical protein
VEWLVPLSTPDPFTAHWMVNGLLAHADSLATQEEVFNNTCIVEFLLQSHRCRHFKNVFMWKWCRYSSAVDLLQASYHGSKEAREKIKDGKPIRAEIYVQVSIKREKFWYKCTVTKNWEINCFHIVFPRPPDADHGINEVMVWIALCLLLVIDMFT